MLLEVYMDDLRRRLDAVVRSLATRDRVSLWLNSSAGEAVRSGSDRIDLSGVIPEVKNEDITDFVLSEFVLYHAWNYQNRRIREAVGE